MDKTNKLKAGDRVRFKNLEKLKQICDKEIIIHKNGELITDSIYYGNAPSFVKEMFELCETYATISYIHRPIYQNYNLIKLTNFSYKGDNINPTKYEYADYMVEKVDEETEQISFETLDELRDKLANLKPKQKVTDIEIKCLEKVCSDLEKEFNNACKEFEEFENEGIDCIKKAKIAVEELKNTYNEAKEAANNESLK